MKLQRRYVEKPWGRTELPPMFDPPAGERIGEVWFTDGAELPLLAKYIFTSERLSVQVHPDDEQARARGLAQGKSECWYILDAEPGATLGLGLTREVGSDELRAAALDGSIEQLMDWRAVAAGDFFFVPSGTIHAIGAGISLLEFQQNADVTYRLYDYGRPRELHLDDGMAVASQSRSMTIRFSIFRAPSSGRWSMGRTSRWCRRARMRSKAGCAGSCRSTARSIGGDEGRPRRMPAAGTGERVETSGARMLIGAKAQPT